MNATQSWVQGNLHLRITSRARVNAVPAVAHGKCVMAVVEKGVIIDKNQSARSRIVFDPDVQIPDRRDRINFRAPAKPRRRENRPKNYLYPMSLGQFDHATNVILDAVQRCRAAVSGNVVGAAQYVYDGRVQGDDIGIESTKHLRRRLTANPPVDAIPSKELGATLLPSLRDGIAHEHDPA